MSRTRAIVGFIVFLAVTFAAAGLGSLFTTPNTGLGGWYDTLPLPPWTPPRWLFGPVWTALYLLMAVAAWLVWRRGGGVWPVRAPLALYAIQLVLNASWSVVFFGQRDVGGGLLVIALLWLAILATLVAFWRVRPLAGALLIPYLLWVSYASALNYAIWRGL